MRKYNGSLECCERAMTCLMAAGDGFLFDYSYDDDCGVDGERDGDYSDNGNSDGNTVARARRLQ